MTTCVRPAQRRELARAPAASSARLAEDPAVRARPRCRRPARASPVHRPAPCAARSPATTADGSPSRAPRRPAGRTSKATPSCSRIARRCGEREARMRRQCEVGEEQRRPRAAADSGESEPWTMFLPTSSAKSPRIEPGRGLERVGRADHLAGGDDGLVALEHQRDQRPRGDELDQLAEERLALVLGVVALGQLLGHRSCGAARRCAGPCARSARGSRRSGRARTRRA